MAPSAPSHEDFRSIVLKAQECLELGNDHQSQHHHQRELIGVTSQPPVGIDPFLSPPHNATRNFSFPTTPRNKASTTLLSLPLGSNGDHTNTRLLMPLDSSFPDTTMMTTPPRRTLLQMRSSDPTSLPVAQQPGACILR